MKKQNNTFTTSAAMAKACQEAQKHIKKGEPIPYGVYISNDIYLHFDGCGLSTILNILKYCGLVRQVANSGKMSDFIHCEK